jgi:hypothetical protein
MIPSDLRPCESDVVDAFGRYQCLPGGATPRSAIGDAGPLAGTTPYPDGVSGLACLGS